MPESIIFKTENAYKQLRKALVEDGLWAVVSLPRGVFNPYSGGKTYILFYDNVMTRHAKDILLVEVKNDGFNLGAQRRPIDKNDLPKAFAVLGRYKKAVQEGEKFKLSEGEQGFASVVEKEKIAENDNYHLSADKYKENGLRESEKWEMVELGEVLDYEQPTKYIVSSVEYNDSYRTSVLTAGKTFILGHTNEETGIFNKDLPVIIFDDFTTAIKYVDFPFKVKSSAMKILQVKKERADIRFLFYIMQKIQFEPKAHKRYWISEYSKIKIPLPPIEVQREIVKKIEKEQTKAAYHRQKIVDSEKEINEKISEVWDS